MRLWAKPSGGVPTGPIMCDRVSLRELGLSFVYDQQVMASIKSISPTSFQMPNSIYMQVPGVPIWEMFGELEFAFLPSRQTVSAMVLCSPMIVHGGT
jgi:hypothetical protein